MVRELKRTEQAGMTNKEIMYVVASEWVDEICMEVVKDADKIMSNPIVYSIVCQAAEAILAYQEERKEIALGEKGAGCLYDFKREDIQAYKKVLYDNLFFNYGGNSADI